MTIFQELKQTFKSPTPLQVAASELAAAELELLKAETGVEFAASLVMFNKQRIKRLKAFLVEQGKKKTS